MRHLFLALLLLKPIYLFSEDNIDILDRVKRPSVEETITSKVSTQNSLIDNNLKNILSNDVPRFVIALERVFPNANWAFIGRDASFLADAIEAFYLSRGAVGRVQRVEVSGSSLSRESDETLLEYLKQFDINPKNDLSSTNGTIFIDVISNPTSGGRQPKRILKAIYKSYLDKGVKINNLLKKINFIGLNKQGSHKYSNKALSNAQEALDQMAKNYENTNSIDDLFSQGLISFQSDDPLHKLSYPIKWHDEYQGFEKNTQGKTVAIEGHPSNHETRSKIIKIQKEMFEFFRDNDFSLIMENYAKKANISIPDSLRASLSRTQFVTKTFFNEPPPEFVAKNLNPGQVVQTKSLGELTIISYVGEGAKGIVYKVKNTDGQLFALKIAKRTSADNLDSISKELVNHRLIQDTLFLQPQMYEIGNGYVVKELINGKNLKEYFKNLDPSKIQEDPIVIQFQKMVSFAVKKKIFIADIQPQNLMINEFGDLFVIDSGRKSELKESPEQALNAYMEETLKKWKRDIPTEIAEQIFNEIGVMSETEFKKIATEHAQKSHRSVKSITKGVDMTKIYKDVKSREQFIYNALTIPTPNRSKFEIQSMSTSTTTPKASTQVETIYKDQLGNSANVSMKVSVAQNPCIERLLDIIMSK